MTTVEQRILDALRVLPPEQAHEVLDFVEFLRSRHDQDTWEAAMPHFKYSFGRQWNTPAYRRKVSGQTRPLFPIPA